MIIRNHASGSACLFKTADNRSLWEKDVKFLIKSLIRRIFFIWVFKKDVFD